MPPQRFQRQHPGHLCSNCKRTFSTVGGLHRHTAHSQVCYAQWELDAHAEEVTSHAATGVNFGFARDAEASMADTSYPIEDFSAHANALDRTNQMDGSPQEADGRPTFARFAQEFFSHPIADVLGCDTTSFERLKMVQDGAGKGPYTPFADRDEWELAQWLVKNANQRMTEEFLKLPIVSTSTSIFEQHH